MQRIIVLSLILVSGAGIASVLPSASLPIGGSPQSVAIEMHEELTFLREKEEILGSHFEILQGEEERVERERRAVQRALDTVTQQSRDAIGRRVKSFEQHRQALERRLMALMNTRRDIREARATLLAISQDRERLEKMIAHQYRELAQKPRGRGVQEQYVRVMPGDYSLLWPVYPAEGISAGFKEISYRKRFGFEHYAIDIPAEQGDLVRAPADGVVTKVNNMGYGYNTLKIEHDDDLETVYGHVSAFLVREGEVVKKGQIIALVGGRPGTKGAGFYTTGSHLHLETRVRGEAVDPTYFLPAIEVATREAY